MLEYTRVVLNQTIGDIKKIGRVANFLTQIIYIAYLIYAIAAPTGIIYVNIPLLVISAAYLCFSIVMERKTQENKDSKDKTNEKSQGKAKEESKASEKIKAKADSNANDKLKAKAISKKNEKIKAKAKEVYKTAKYIILIPTLITSIITLITYKGENITFPLLFTVLMIFTYTLSVLLSVITKIVERRLAMFEVAIKADLEPYINAINTFRKFKGERVEESAPDKAEQKIKSDLDAKVNKIREETPPKANDPDKLSGEELKAVRKEIINSIALKAKEKAKQKFVSFKDKLVGLASPTTKKTADAIEPPKTEALPSPTPEDTREPIEK